MGNLRVSNEVILAKIEVTYNTDPVPVAATNAVLVQNVAFDNVPIRMVDRPAVRANVGHLQRVFAGQLGKIKFDVEIKGSGTAGTIPELSPLLRAVGLLETVNAGVSVLYAPRSTLYESITLYWYEGGRKLHKLTGVRGNMTMKLTAGGIALMSFELTGHVLNPTDQSQPAPTYITKVPAPVLNMAVSLGGVTAIIAREWTLNLGNKIALPPSIAATDGYGEIQITERDITGQFIMDAELASVIDLDTQLSAGTSFTFASGQLGSVAGNKFAAASSTNGMYWMDRNFGAQEAMRVRTMPYGMVESATGNDDITLTFT
jgi:tail tube protein